MQDLTVSPNLLTLLKDLTPYPIRVSHIHYRVIGGRGIYWASDVEPRDFKRVSRLGLTVE